MSISAVSSPATNILQSQNDSGWQQFAQLTNSIQSGDVDAAQQAYTDFTQSPAGKAAESNPDNPLAQALSQIGQSLQSGDISGAQQALAALKSRGHHHHGGSDGKHQTNATPASTASTDPNAPGANFNVIA